MGNYDWIGWLAMILTCLSFIFDNQRIIRLSNAFACIVWIVYGLLINSLPTVGVNLVVLIIHLIWFYNKNKKTI
jgi:uncharacterized protein with PQ loop repeat